MDIGKIFSRSWEIFWNNKVLWIFGVLAGCGSRNPSTSFSGSSNYSTGPGEVREIPPEFQGFILEMQRYFSEPGNVALFIAAIFCIGLLLSIISLLVGSAGRAGLIKGVLQIEGGQNLEGFGPLWEASSPYMMRLFGLNFLIGLAVFAAMLVLVGGFVLFSVITFGVGALLVCLLIPLLLIGMVFLSIYIEQANVALVAEDTGIGAALGRSWEIIRGNKGNVIGMGVLIFILRAVLMIVFGMVFLFAFAGVFFAVGVTGAEEMMGFVGGLIAAMLMFSVIYILFNGLLTSFTGTAWTLTYQGAAMHLPPIGAGTSAIEESESDDESAVEEA